ncbi:MAG: T9SS type A sorting domain-containing protein [Bacteroidetes bacterium]|nr:T9SS type A sorting domain-containing protein [Bacteroidota bacterium]
MKNLLTPILVLISCAINAQGWTQKADFAGSPAWGAVSFSIGNKGYMGTGETSSGFSNEFWEYDPLTDTWAQKADFGGGWVAGAVGFAMGNKGCIGTGRYAGTLADFWEYDPVSNTWTQKADFGGGPKNYAVGFAIGNKGYVGTGNYGVGSIDFWEYDPQTDTWTQKADFSGAARLLATGFSIGNKGYLGAGINGTGDTCYNDFWEYDPAIDTWTQKSDFFAGMASDKPVGFSIGNKGYIGTGIPVCFTWSGEPNFAKYDPISDTWQFISDPFGVWLNGLTAFTIGNKAYIGNGVWYGNLSQNFWEFEPDCYAGFSLNPDTIPHTYIAVNYSSGTPPLTYLWSWGDGSFSTGASPSHTYSAAGNYNICLNITDNTGCMDSFCYSSYLSRMDMNATIVTVNVINSVTGLNHENTNNDNITLCPNPVSNQLIVEINSLEPAEIIIHDMTSRKHFQKSFISSISINTELFSKGIYLYEVRNKTGVIKKGKVVKN